MNEEDFANIIRLVRRTPLANMDEAEAVARLLQKFSAFVLTQLQGKNDANEERQLSDDSTDSNNGNDKAINHKSI